MDILSGFAGVVLSLAASYLPGFSEWFGALESRHKQLVLLGVLAALSLAMFGIACAGLSADLGLSYTCDRAGAVQLVRMFGIAVIANQATYPITRKS